MMPVVSVNKILIASMLRYRHQLLAHNKKNDDVIKSLLKQLTARFLRFFYEPVRCIYSLTTTANIITPEDVNKYGDEKLSQILNIHGYAMTVNSAGVRYV